MDAPSAIADFLDLLVRSELLTDDVSARVRATPRYVHAESPDVAARRLVADGLITDYQARRLLEGRTRGFFIHQYRLCEILGSGGMGTLFLANDRTSGDRVAVKVLAEKCKHDAAMRTRFELEARAGMRLRHPNLVLTLELGRTDDLYGEVPYLVMEFVESVNLHELIALQGRIPWPQAADIARQAAIGLHHAHEAGLIHRDVKPANLLVDRTGRVRVLDFGLALLDRDASDDEFSLAMIFGQGCVGTDDFIAPEQTIDARTVDRRADLYSLGCTLYAALTGHLPFPQKTSVEKLEAQRSQSPRPVATYAPDVPTDFVAVLDRLLSKVPENRYATAQQVADALEPFAARAPAEFDFRNMLKLREEHYRRKYGVLPGTGPASSVARSSTTWTSRSTPRSSVGARPPASTVNSAAGETQTSSPATPEPVPRTIAAPQEVHEAAARGLSGAQANLLDSRSELIGEKDFSRLPLLRDRVVVGRAPECDLVLAGSGVSARHCELRFEGCWWRVVDLGSKNGIQVNGRDVRDQVLWPGDRLTIARQHPFRIHYTLAQAPGTRRWGWWLAAAALATGTAGAVFSVWW